MRKTPPRAGGFSDIVQDSAAHRPYNVRMPLHLTEAQLNEPVSAHVRSDFTTLYPDWTVGAALDHMRKFPPPGRIIYFYVVDEQTHLHGVVPTRRLLLSPPESRVRDVMIGSVISIPADATVLEACEFF